MGPGYWLLKNVLTVIGTFFKHCAFELTSLVWTLEILYETIQVKQILFYPLAATNVVLNEDIEHDENSHMFDTLLKAGDALIK